MTTTPKERRKLPDIDPRIGTFVDFIDALDNGELALAAHHQGRLQELGFKVKIRPLGPPMDQARRTGEEPP